MLGISYREQKMTEYVWQRELLLLTYKGYHGSAMSAVTIRCHKSCRKEQWLVVVAEEDRVNHG